MKRIFILVVFLGPVIATGQTDNTSTLSIKQIMQGEDFVGFLPTNVRWSDDSKTIFFSWNPDDDTVRSTHKIDLESKNISQLTFQELMKLPESGDYTRDFSRKVFDRDGDLFLLNMNTYKEKQLTNTTQRETNPVFTQDEKAIVFRQDNNLFRWDLTNGSITQLTNFKDGTERKKDKLSEQDQWLEQDQLAFFEILRERDNKANARKYRNEMTEPDRPLEVFTGNKRISSLVISPEERYVWYSLFESAKADNTKVPDFVTQSGYTTDLSARPKVGSPQGNFEYWILDTVQDTTYEVITDDIPGIRDKPIYLKDYAEDPDSYIDTLTENRSVRITSPVFSEDGKGVVSVTSRDYKDRWIMQLDLESGKMMVIDRQHDDAWIGGPGVGWFNNGVLGWLDSDNIYFQSEKTGYSHLYNANIKSGKIKALTSGDFEVVDVQLSKDKKTFYLTTNEVSPHQHHFYHMPARGGKRTKITSRDGGHEVTVSPDEKMLAIRYSYINDPWELYVMPNKPDAQMVKLTKSTNNEFESYNWRVPEIIQFEAADGARVPASLYIPDEDRKNGAAVIFVHGAGYLQNVHNWWRSYYREYMFHNFLADNGYTVLAADFRASRGYGRDWRTAIYRHMGGRDLDDQVDGAKYLIAEQGIDPDKIGIYGGSYGGFITLMALFKYPEVFKSGAALRSVTDWAHYNHGYTANILNTPVQDSLAYARSSPIYYAEGLQGNLLMLHGMIDTNVHFQDVVRLSQRLIELEKENWELAVFPLEGHGFVESSSWADEYRRIYELFQKTLVE